MTDLGQPPGARTVIEELSRRDTISCLALRHNKLGDDGCAELFKYLCSEEGQRYKLSRILLNANSLGNVALGSISNFLRDNRWLRDLYLACVRPKALTDGSATDSFCRMTSPATLMSSPSSLKRSILHRWRSCRYPAAKAFLTPLQKGFSLTSILIISWSSNCRQSG